MNNLFFLLSVLSPLLTYGQASQQDTVSTNLLTCMDVLVLSAKYDFPYPTDEEKYSVKKLVLVGILQDQKIIQLTEHSFGFPYAPDILDNQQLHYQGDLCLDILSLGAAVDEEDPKVVVRVFDWFVAGPTTNLRRSEKMEIIKAPYAEEIEELISQLKLENDVISVTNNFVNLEYPRY